MNSRTISVLTGVLLVTTALRAQELAATNAAKEVDNWYKEGERTYRSGDHAAAVVLFSKVLTADPGHQNAHLQRGFCYSLLREYDKAVIDFTAVIATKNDHTWAYTSRGSAYTKLGQHDLAIADFNRVLELDPKNQEALNNRGWAKKATGDQSGACQDWNTSKRMGNAEAKIILKNNHCK
ncbi:MAG: tetratricopeptide repeat protein [Flavobacteriales bacterium]|nr:tetratricopeptide repeat protein [Flavobacteriales bacterium]